MNVETMFLVERIRDLYAKGWRDVRFGDPHEAILKLHAIDPDGQPRELYFDPAFSVWAQLLGMEFDYLAEKCVYRGAVTCLAYLPAGAKHPTWHRACPVPFTIRLKQPHRPGRGARWSEPFTGRTLRGVDRAVGMISRAGDDFPVLVTTKTGNDDDR